MIRSGTDCFHVCDGMRLLFARAGGARLNGLSPVDELPVFFRQDACFRLLLAPLDVQTEHPRSRDHKNKASMRSCPSSVKANFCTT